MKEGSEPPRTPLSQYQPFSPPLNGPEDDVQTPPTRLGAGGAKLPTPLPLSPD